jgi:hypothetical protein
MDFELTISGLCVVSLKSEEPFPTSPDAVDVVCPKDGMHRARLCYDPTLFQVGDLGSDPDLVIDPNGSRFANLDLEGRVLELTLSENPATEFSLSWGPSDAEAPPEEQWMNWTPSLGTLGFETFVVPPSREMPAGARTRLILPKGELQCRSVVRDPDTNKFVLWSFPATRTELLPDGIERALANEIVFRARGRTLRILNEQGESILSATEPKATLKMCISNDVSKVPPDFGTDQEALSHLEHLESLAPKRVDFEAPTPSGNQRTGRTICNQVINIRGGR